MSETPLELLLLEDSATDAELLGARLSGAGVDARLTRVATREAFTQALDEPWDAIVADFRLPGFDALQALDVVAARGLDVPVIVVTGAVGEEVAVECMKRGAVDYLLKDRLTRLPAAIGQAIEQRRVRRIADAADEDLRHAHEETIRRLAMALDSRSQETGAHVTRMSTLASRLAERLGVEGEDLAFFPLAAAMHDIGKIGIPDAVLDKPGPLTAEERRVMQKHAQIGHDILSGSGSELLDLAAEIALTHHEHWSGGGYPRQLAGAGIPLSGRIAAVVDVFDALTSVRVYRPAMTREQALEIMTAGRGTHFDPVVLDAFLELLDSGSLDDALADGA